MSFEFREGQELRKKRLLLGHWSFLGPGEEENSAWNAQFHKLEGQWNSTAGVMVGNFKESGHPVIRATGALKRGFLKRKGGRCTIHFNAESSNAELFFRTIHSANQLSIYGAVASWCEELTQLIPGQTHVSMDTSVAKVNDLLSQKLEPLSTDTKEEWSSSGRPPAYSSLKIWRTVEGDPHHESLWICGIREESLHRNVLMIPGLQMLGGSVQSLTVQHMVVLDLGCTRSIGSRTAIEILKKHAWYYGITTEFCRCNKSFVFANSETETCKKLHNPLSHNTTIFYQSRCAWDRWCAIVSSLSHMKNLGSTYDLDPKGDKITWLPFGLYSPPSWALHNGTYCVGRDESCVTGDLVFKSISGTNSFSYVQQNIDQV